MKEKNTLVPVFLAGIAAGAMVGLMVLATKDKKMERKEKLSAGLSDPLYKKYADMLKRLNAKLDTLKEETAEMI